jgi:hypothetical protein
MVFNATLNNISVISYHSVLLVEETKENQQPAAAWRPSWLEVGITGHKFGRGPSKDHSTKVWLQLALWFPRRRLKGEMLTDGRQTMDEK